MEGTIGEIRGFAGNFAPRTWSFCEGQFVSISANQALFSIIGTTYGGDGRTTFALPDLRGRTPISSGSGPGLSTYLLGQRSGAEIHSLTTNQMPAHSHAVNINDADIEVDGAIMATMSVSTSEAEDSSPSGNYLGVSSADVYADSSSNGNTLNNAAINVDTSGLGVSIPSSAIAISSSGTSQAFSVMQPYLTINWIICTAGVFPSRS